MAPDVPTDKLREMKDRVLAEANAALSRLERKPRTGRPCPKRTKMVADALKASGETPPAPAAPAAPAKEKP